MRTKLHTRRAAAALLATVLLSGLVGCGSGGGGTQQAATSKESPSATESSPSPAGTKPYTAETLVPAMTAAMEEYETAHIGMDFDAQGMTFTAEADTSYAAGKPAMSMLMNVPGQNQPIEMRLVEGAFYMSMPPATPPGKFLKMDPSDPNDPLVAQMGDLTQMMDQLDPKKSTEALQDGIRMVEYVGPASSPDGPLDHYRMTVDLQTVATAQGLDPKDLRGAPKTVDYEVWLDEEDRMRRMRMDLMGTAMDMRFSDWGEPVDITAPPPSQIVKGPRTNS